MAILWLFLTIAVLTAFAGLALVTGADSRAGVDGDSCFGRRHHEPETWW